MRFASNTPYDTSMSLSAQPQRVMSPGVAATVRRALTRVVSDGTAVLGVLKTSGDLEVELLNMAQRSQRYPFSSIVEIYIDSLV